MSYCHLNLQERYVIYHLKLYGLSIAEMGRRLGWSGETISRELRRNTGRFQDIYWHESAHMFARQRRSQAPRPSKQRNPMLYEVSAQKTKSRLVPGADRRAPETHLSEDLRHAAQPRDPLWLGLC